MKTAHYALLLSIALLITSCSDIGGSDFTNYDNTADLEFLEENAAREDVTVTESGLQYRIIEDADGVSPAEESIVAIHFITKLVDGSVYNNSYDGDAIPAIISVRNLLIGLSEGVQLMNTGAIYELVLPAELAFGNNPPQGIPPGATLIYEVELIHENSLDSVFLEENAAEEDVMVLESGLQYRIIEEGTGESPEANSTVEVEYTGKFVFGTVFDTSTNSGASASFDVDGVIPGLSEGLQLMNQGARYEFFVPASLGYDNEPPPNSIIYPGATLVFEVELLDIL